MSGSLKSADRSPATYRHWLPPPSLRATTGRYIESGGMLVAERWQAGCWRVAVRFLQAIFCRLLRSQSRRKYRPAPRLPLTCHRTNTNCARPATCRFAKIENVGTTSPDILSFLKISDAWGQRLKFRPPPTNCYWRSPATGRYLVKTGIYNVGRQHLVICDDSFTKDKNDLAKTMKV